MDLFKLIFENDLRLDDLRERQLDREKQDTTLSIEAFMRPDPVYSRLYFSGTRMDEERYGLSALRIFPQLLSTFDSILAGYRIVTESSTAFTLKQALESAEIGEAILFSETGSTNTSLKDLHVDDGSNVGHRKEPLRNALLEGELVMYKEKAHDGYDLHLFSRDNIYTLFFFSLKELVSDEFRFFSINGKRVRSERQFYFEKWSLERPPHGAEEVFPETVL